VIFLGLKLHIMATSLGGLDKVSEMVMSGGNGMAKIPMNVIVNV
jgi:hypothetical protein